MDKEKSVHEVADEVVKSLLRACESKLDPQLIVATASLIKVTESARNTSDFLNQDIIESSYLER